MNLNKKKFLIFNNFLHGIFHKRFKIDPFTVQRGNAFVNILNLFHSEIFILIILHQQRKLFTNIIKTDPFKLKNLLYSIDYLYLYRVS